MKIILQYDQTDCGPACMAMICSYYGKNYTLQYLRDNCFITSEGVSLFGITEAAIKVGFETLPAKLTIDNLVNSVQAMPCILHWEKNHFVVLKKIKRNRFNKRLNFVIADPNHGYISFDEDQLKKSWLSDGNMGISLFLNPTESFYKASPAIERKVNLQTIISYLKPHKVRMSLVFFALLIGSGINLMFPFLTQKFIDKGVNAKDYNFVTLILIAQLALFFGSIIVEVIRNWLILLIGTKISINIISRYLSKVLQLPLKFFDSKKAGDFNQRIQDNQRIEEFLTSQALTTVFSIITFSFFFFVLLYYSISILSIYILLTALSIAWSFYWLKKRKLLDYFRFQHRGENQEAIYEIINGVSEMKLNQFEDFKRKEWESIQGRLFSINIKFLRLNQIQVSGFDVINQVKNILVTYISATLVISNKMTLGSLLSVSYILGQLNSPVNQLVYFFRSFQDAKLSLERLDEVQDFLPEEQAGQLSMSHVFTKSSFDNSEKGIRLENVSFQYQGSKSPYALKDISLFIPEGKITAIVGGSGSGKTTLLKLLLRFYEPSYGNIFYNSTNLNDISPKSLRENTGVVLQDAHIFSDTIERNIATGDPDIDPKKFKRSINIANIREFIDTLPLKANTKIGATGNGLSGGQRQRLLIARAVYRDPQYLFFDEATSALDAENEKIVYDNLQDFFQGRTVLVIAHRLSTVKNADQIIVLNKGQVVEYGNHRDLVSNRSDYYNLVRNQLELGT